MSRAPHFRSATTATTGMSRRSSASRMVPLPDARTPTLTQVTLSRDAVEHFAGRSPRPAPKDVSISRARTEGVMADQQSPTPGELTIMAAGAVMIVFSFVSFSNDRNAWAKGLFPIATLLPLYGLVMALQIALTKFAPLRLPRSVLGFTWEQIHLA